MSVPGAPAARPRQRLRLALATLALALLVGELIARKYISGAVDFLRSSPDPVLRYELKPGSYETDGYFLRTPPVEYHIDDDGCRRFGGAPGGRPSVLYLGSSLIFGIGVSLEETIPYQIAETLGRRSPGAQRPSVNCAVPGYNLEQTLRSAAQHTARLRPDLVVILVDSAHMRGPFDWTAVSPSNAAVHWLTGHLRLARLGYLYYLIKHNDSFKLPPIEPQAIERGLAELSAALEASGAKVVFFPNGMPPDEPFDLRGRLRARGFPARDVTPPERSPAFFLADHEHWNLQGNRFVADQMVTPIADALGARPAPP